MRMAFLFFAMAALVMSVSASAQQQDAAQPGAPCIAVTNQPFYGDPNWNWLTNNCDGFASVVFITREGGRQLIQMLPGSSKAADRAGLSYRMWVCIDPARIDNGWGNRIPYDPSTDKLPDYDSARAVCRVPKK